MITNPLPSPKKSTFGISQQTVILSCYDIVILKYMKDFS